MFQVIQSLLATGSSIESEEIRDEKIENFC